MAKVMTVAIPRETRPGVRRLLVIGAVSAGLVAAAVGVTTWTISDVPEAVSVESPQVLVDVDAASRPAFAPLARIVTRADDYGIRYDSPPGVGYQARTETGEGQFGGKPLP